MHARRRITSGLTDLLAILTSFETPVFETAIFETAGFEIAFSKRGGFVYQQPETVLLEPPQKQMRKMLGKSLTKSNLERCGKS